LNGKSNGKFDSKVDGSFAMEGGIGLLETSRVDCFLIFCPITPLKRKASLL
jgi:hypothetical protein